MLNLFITDYIKRIIIILAVGVSVLVVIRCNQSRSSEKHNVNQFFQEIIASFDPNDTGLDKIEFLRSCLYMKTVANQLNEYYSFDSLDNSFILLYSWKPVYPPSLSLQLKFL